MKDANSLPKSEELESYLLHLPFAERGYAVACARYQYGSIRICPLCPKELTKERSADIDYTVRGIIDSFRLSNMGGF